MDPKLAEAIGLLRHQIISPVLMESAPAQMTYFNSLSQREFDIPGRGLRRFTPGTMKAWLYRYRKNGFQALLPKTRTDRGGFRKLTPEMKEAIIRLRGEHLESSCTKFYERCLREKVLGDPPICREVLRRYLKSKNLYQTRTATPRKRYEMSYFGELWVGDFMHGPLVREQPGKGRHRKAILLAIIDDHSRMIVGSLFGFLENTKLLEVVFKDAILNHGLPDRFYCDNGPAFVSQYLARTCATLNIALVHSKPYDSPSRGKIERFFRNVRESFLAENGLTGEKPLDIDLKELNTRFAQWLRQSYHHAHHRGIDARPIDRYQTSVRQYPRRRVSEDSLDEMFLVSCNRTVAKDSTVSLHGVDYEVPPQYIGKRVELKFSQDHPGEIFLYDNGQRQAKVLPVDAVMNGKLPYRPQPRISDVALHAVANPKQNKQEEK